MITRYPGDRPIPTNQPILGRCGLCDAWVVYGVDASAGRLHGGNTHGAGLILADTSVRGGAWLLLPDGRYRPNGDPARWAARMHRCPSRVLRLATMLRNDEALPWDTTPDTLRRARIAAFGRVGAGT